MNMSSGPVSEYPSAAEVRFATKGEFLWKLQRWVDRLERRIYGRLLKAALLNLC